MRGPGLELAFVGCGAATRTHARTLRRLRAPVRLAFASTDPGRARDAASEHGGRALASYDAALADPGVDAVVIATPPASHRELALAALAAGKHVVVEKPAFPRVEDFDDVAEAARRGDRLVLVAENYFYKPALRRLRAVIASGALGEVMLVAVNALKRQRRDGWRGDPALAGGGPLLEGGVHWVHLMANLGLAVRGVTARASGRPGEETIHALFDYEAGAVGALHFSWEAFAPLGGVRLSRVHGRRGSVAFESNGAFVAAVARAPSLLVARPSELSGHAEMWRAFLAALARGDDPDGWLERARLDVALVDEIYRAVGR